MGYGFDSVVGGVRSVTRNVGGCGSMSGCTGSSPGRGSIGVTGGGVDRNCSGAGLAHLYLSTRPSPPCLDGFPWSVVFRVLLLEVRKHVLGTVGGLERQRIVVPFI